ncbi:MAG: molecular chaperone HtpG [Lachnospiraceae bacterium]|nr:molecular chaperone HtpG [Lachnospiraceae bacterium]
MAQIQKEQGNLTFNSENMFPIIKKWLYSDHDIFMRELVSNGCDAITKLKKLEIVGEYQMPADEKFRVDVTVNSESKTISFADNGIGMTADEVREYITQVAFSGAADFLEKYKDKTSEEQIIGHFGLGFYSAFMVADKVTIDTLSFEEGAEPVYWECTGESSYTMREGTKTGHGTVVTLYLNDECLEFSNYYRAEEVLKKYCSFMPVEIYLHKEGGEQEYQTVGKDELLPDDVIAETIVDEAKTEETTNEDGTKETIEISPRKERFKINKRPELINETHPLWTRHPNDCTEEEYKEFYRKVFHDYRDPLFWIHLNMDYPFNLKGILYFPKISTEYESAEGVIKLYNNQVFVADNIKEVIPEFLMLLKGVIDCPDLPLNVSRSALQNDGFVTKISDYITKKVADKLSGMYKTDRGNYEKYWEDINPFIKYGIMKDQKFADKMNDYVIYRNLDGKYTVLKDYLEAAKETHENKVFYVSDENQQSQYIRMFKAEGLDAVMLTRLIDVSFISKVEADNEGVQFIRIDSDIADVFKEKPTEEEEQLLQEQQEKLSEIWKKATGIDSLTVKVEKLKDAGTPAVMTMSEDIRRFQDMMQMYGMQQKEMRGSEGQTLTLNANNELVKYVLENPEGEHTDLFCQQIYDLAYLSHASLDPEAMTKFISRSNEIMTLLAK